MQVTLNAAQLTAFYHDEFVKRQVEDFSSLTASDSQNLRIVLDVGGGCGYFASALQKNSSQLKVRVMDMDSKSVESANHLGVEASLGDALNPAKRGDEDIVCFNLILHHLVASNDEKTTALQEQAIAAWRYSEVKIFVNEYIYESWFGGFSGWLIYHITHNQLLSSLASNVARMIPSLKANTFGVGVRFRSNSEWKKLFASAGFVVSKEAQGEQEFISWARRLLLIKTIRRDSFLLIAH